MQTIWQNFRDGLRMLVRNRLFAILAILAMAIGLGANSTILNFVRAHFALAAPREAASQDSPSKQEWIDREFAASGAPSLTLVVAQDGRFLWERSWGWADKEKRILATPQTMY